MKRANQVILGLVAVAPFMRAQASVEKYGEFTLNVERRGGYVFAVPATTKISGEAAGDSFIPKCKAFESQIESMIANLEKHCTGSTETSLCTLYKRSANMARYGIDAVTDPTQTQNHAMLGVFSVYDASHPYVPNNKRAAVVAQIASRSGVPMRNVWMDPSPRFFLQNQLIKTVDKNNSIALRLEKYVGTESAVTKGGLFSDPDHYGIALSGLDMICDYLRGRIELTGTQPIRAGLEYAGGLAKEKSLSAKKAFQIYQVIDKSRVSAKDPVVYAVYGARLARSLAENDRDMQSEDIEASVRLLFDLFVNTENKGFNDYVSFGQVETLFPEEIAMSTSWVAANESAP
jgi:hypothetical protein